MRILVCFKLTKDFEHLTISEIDDICNKKQTVKYFTDIISVYDEAALEMALQLYDMATSRGECCTITAVTVANEANSRILSDLKALKFDDIVHLSYAQDTDFNPESVAEAIMNFIGYDNNFDVILTGQQSSPGENGKVGCIIASKLNIPYISFVSDLRITSNKCIKVNCKINAGTAEFDVSASAVYAIQNSKHPYLRVATLREKMNSKQKQIRKIACETNAQHHAAGTELLKLRYTYEKRKCKIIKEKNVNENVDALWELYIKEEYKQ